MTKLQSTCFILLAAVVIGAAGGCGSGTRVTITVPPKEEQPRPIINRYAFAYFITGVLAEKEQQFLLAVESYKQALEYSPGNSEISYALAKLLYQLRQYDEALKTASRMYYKDKDAYSLIGDCYRILGEDDKAASAYAKVLRMDPDDTHAHWYSAAYARNRDDYDKAIYHLKAVARANPTGRIYAEIAKAYTSQGKYDEAIDAYRRSLEIDWSETNIESYINLAALLQQTGAIEEAEKVMLRAIDENPGQPSTRLYLAEIYADLGDTTRAIDQIRVIRRIASDQMPMLNHAGQIAFELDNLELADSLFADELARFPESVLGNYFRGRIAIYQDRLQEAKRFFWTLIEVADSLPDGYINLGVLYMDEDSTDLAIDILNEGAISATRGREEVQYYLGTALSRAERYDEVINLTKQLVSNHPGEIRFMFMLGSALERSQQHDSAAVIFERILKIDPNHAQTLNYLGYMWADLGVNLSRSLDLIQKALDVDEENPAYLDSYGWVLYKLGKYDKAESYIRRAIELMDYPDSVIYDHLADIYDALGRHEEAKANWRKALELDPNNDGIREKLAR